MITDYVNKLIENLPTDIQNVNKPIKIDLVLDGGFFNGSYLVGALYFLKEMEKRKHIKIERISGCSIGSFVAFLYFIDELDLMNELYGTVKTNFKKYYNLIIIKHIKKYFKNKIPTDICSKVNNKLFISYNNVKKIKKTVKSKYKNEDDIINTIIKSCYVPYLVDGNCLYNNKYIDGVNPYIFKPEKNRKVLYLDLFGYDKIFNLLNIKNEETNYHRVLSGLIDIHNFFIKKSSTQMCSYVNDWNYCNIFINNIKLLIEKIIIYLMYFFILIQENIIIKNTDSILFLLCKLMQQICHQTFVSILETYCL